MKNLISILIFFVLLSLGACKRNQLQDAIVVRDCTGIYLRLNGQDFFVCNYQKLAAFEDGEDVKVSVETLETCQSDLAVCLMGHPTAGFVRVRQVVDK